MVVYKKKTHSWFLLHFYMINGQFILATLESLNVACKDLWNIVGKISFKAKPLFWRLGWAPWRANVFSTFFLKIEHTVCPWYLSDLYREENFILSYTVLLARNFLVCMLLVAEMSWSSLRVKRGHLNGFSLQSSLDYIGTLPLLKLH